MPRLHHFVAKAFMVVFLVFFSTGVLFAADVTVPRFSLTSRGTIEDSTFQLDTRADLDVSLEGGYKFGGNLAFSFESTQLEEAADLPETYDAQELAERLSRTLLFQSASITIRELFGAPLNMRYYSGRMERFGTAEEFVRTFGTNDFGTHFQGYTTFPDGVPYEGLFQVEGTGIELQTSPLADTYVLRGYTYQDPRLGSGRYSSDLRFLANTELLKAELFLGASYPQAAYGIYRAGLLTFFQTSGDGPVQGQFFTQLGLPRWNPEGASDLSLEDFYFLFEPRLKFPAFLPAAHPLLAPGVLPSGLHGRGWRPGRQYSGNYRRRADLPNSRGAGYPNDIQSLCDAATRGSGGTISPRCGLGDPLGHLHPRAGVSFQPPGVL